LKSSVEEMSFLFEELQILANRIPPLYCI